MLTGSLPVVTKGSLRSANYIPSNGVTSAIWGRFGQQVDFLNMHSQRQQCKR